MSSAEISSEKQEGGRVRIVQSGGWGNEDNGQAPFPQEREGNRSNNTAPLFSPVLQKETLDITKSQLASLPPNSQHLVSLRCSLYSVPRTAQLVCFSYAVTSLAYMLSVKSLNKD